MNIYLENESNVEESTLNRIDGSKEHINDREDKQTIEKTQLQATKIDSGDWLRSSPSLEGRVIKGPPIQITEQPKSEIEQTIETLESKIEQSPNGEAISVSLDDFPNFAWEAIKAGMDRELRSNNILNKYITEAKTYQDSIELLLKLEASLNNEKKNQSETMSEETKETLHRLSELGVDLKINGDYSLNANRIDDLKSLVSKNIDQFRTKLQTLITTKIQVEVNAIGTILDILKQIITNNNSLIRKATEIPR